MKFLNISNHTLTEEQVKDLNRFLFCENIEIIELPKELKEDWAHLTPQNYIEVCLSIYSYMYANDIHYAHLAGFTPAVIELIKSKTLVFCYSFSERVSKEKKANGEIIKISTFKHKGWYRY